MFTATQTVYGAVAFDKLSWFEAVPVQLTIAGSLAAIFLSAGVGWPIAMFFAKKSEKPSLFSVRAAEMILLAVSALNLAFVAFMWFFLRDLQESGNIRLSYGPPLSLYIALWMMLFTTIFAIVLPVFSILAFRRHYWSRLGRLHYAMVAVAGLCFIAFLNHWNLLGLRL
jgi:hypothetical protein